MSKYIWRLEAFAKGIDPDLAVQELERIEKELGGLTPENIVEGSKSKKSVLHKLFEWDDTKAAQNYRLQQARTILNNIQVKIVSDGQEREVDVFEVVRKDDGSVYKSIAAFDPDDVAQVKARIVRELNYMKKKLSFYKEFEFASQKIQDAIEYLGR